MSQCCRKCTDGQTADDIWKAPSNLQFNSDVLIKHRRVFCSGELILIRNLARFFLWGLNKIAKLTIHYELNIKKRSTYILFINKYRRRINERQRGLVILKCPMWSSKYEQTRTDSQQALCNCCMFSCDLTSSGPANKLQNNYISDVLNNNYMNKCKMRVIQRES